MAVRSNSFSEGRLIVWQKNGKKYPTLNRAKEGEKLSWLFVFAKKLWLLEIIFVSDKSQLIEKYQLTETWHQFLAKDVNQAPIAQSTSFQTAEIVAMEGHNTHINTKTHTHPNTRRQFCMLGLLHCSDNFYGWLSEIFPWWWRLVVLYNFSRFVLPGFLYKQLALRK